MEDVLRIYIHPNQSKREQICFDECTFQLLDDIVTLITVKPDKVAEENNEYVRQGTSVVLLANDLDKGIRYRLTREQRTRADYAQFMHYIIATYYADVDYIDLVLDNLNAHKYSSCYEDLSLAQAWL